MQNLSHPTGHTCEPFNSQRATKLHMQIIGETGKVCRVASCPVTVTRATRPFH